MLQQRTIAYVLQHISLLQQNYRYDWDIIPVISI